MDAKHPRCVIRQLISGPITDNPRSAAAEEACSGRSVALRPSEAANDHGRFSWRSASVDALATVESSQGDDTKTDPTNALGDTKEPTTQNTTVSAQETPTIEGVQRKELGSGADAGTSGVGGMGEGDGQPLDTAAFIGAVAPALRQMKPVSADGERSFLQAFLDAGHSPSTAIAAGFEPSRSSRGVPPSVVAEAVKVEFVGTRLVLGPVVGRVTQQSAVVLVEVGSTAAVACLLTDGVTGWRHRQVWLSLSYTVHPTYGGYLGT